VLAAALLVSWAFRNLQFIGPVSDQEALYCPNFIRGFCYLPRQDDNFNLAFVLCLSLGLTAMTSALPTFKEEKLMFKRERVSGTSTLAYFIGKNLAEIPSILIQPIFYLFVFYLVSTPFAPTYQFYFTFTGIQFSAMGLGYIASTIVNAKQSLIVGVVLVFTSVIISGYRPSLTEWDTYNYLSYVPNISFARWAMESIYLAQVTPYQGIYSLDSTMALLGYNVDHYLFSTVLMFVLGMIYRGIACVALFCRE